MGISVIVPPSLQMVGERGKHLVIVNLQCTPLDQLAKLRIYAKTDDVSRMLMSKLGLEIPEFRLRRWGGGGRRGGTRRGGKRE